MATVTQVLLTCDVCGTAEDVRTWTFGLDGGTYEIDLCGKDGSGLRDAAARFTAAARSVPAGKDQRHDGHRPRSGAAAAAAADQASKPGKDVSGRGRVAGSARRGAKTSRPGQRAARTGRARAKSGRSTEKARAARPKRPKAEAASARPASPAGASQQKGIYVYGILPADIEVAGDMPGVGEHPGPLRAVRRDGLAALISDVDLSARPESPDDRRTHRDILDAVAAEVPVVPLRFGTILAGEDAVAEDLLAAHHEELTAALDQLEGRAQFLVKGRYVQDAALDEAASQDQHAGRQDDARALLQAMEEVGVASVAHEPADELDAVHVAFLVATDKESQVERVIEDLAQAWEGRIEVQLLGPMAAYDFVGTADPED